MGSEMSCMTTCAETDLLCSRDRKDDTFGYAKKERPYENEDGNLQSVLGHNVKHYSGTNANTAGIGAVFAVDETGAVFFNTAVPGSACFDVMDKDMIRHGDVLYSVDGQSVYRAPLKTVARKLLGPAGTTVTVCFRRGMDAEMGEEISVELQRRLTDVSTAKKTVSDATNMQFTQAEKPKSSTSPLHE